MRAGRTDGTRRGVTESSGELKRRVDELEHQLARERQTQFELRRQLLVADESLAQLTAQHGELESSRSSVVRLVSDATRISSESGDADALWALIAQISHLVSEGQPARLGPVPTPHAEPTTSKP